MEIQVKRRPRNALDIASLKTGDTFRFVRGESYYMMLGRRQNSTSLRYVKFDNGREYDVADICGREVIKVKATVVIEEEE